MWISVIKEYIYIYRYIVTLYVLPGEIALSFKIAIKTLLPVRRSRDKNGGKIKWLTRMQLRQEASLPGLHGSFWKVFCWGRLDRHQCLLGSSSAEEGWTDTNAYWEAPLLRKARQTPMFTWKHSELFRSWERSHSWMDFFAVSFVVDIESCKDE